MSCPAATGAGLAWNAATRRLTAVWEEPPVSTALVSLTLERYIPGEGYRPVEHVTLPPGSSPHTFRFGFASPGEDYQCAVWITCRNCETSNVLTSPPFTIPG